MSRIGAIFAAAFDDSVHVGLDKILGHSGTEAVLVHMKMADGLPGSAEFHAKLLALFGPAGTLSLERSILKHLMREKSYDVLEKDGVLDFDATVSLVRRGVKESPQELA
jgi:hypothetical protein